MTPQKILVCGASGFIGGNVFSDLRARCPSDDVYGTYFQNQKHIKENDRLFFANLTDQSHVDRVVRGADIIIQAAAVTAGMNVIKKNPESLIHDNLSMNARIFEAAHRLCVPRVIFLSCSLMYDQLSERPAKETDLDLNRPMTRAYFGGAWMKVYLEKLCEFYSKLGRTVYTVIRHSNVYGPGDSFDPERSHVTAATIKKVADAKDGGTIIVWGNGKEQKDLLYVSDLSEFLCQMIHLKQQHFFEIVNVGSGRVIPIRDLISRIIAISGKKILIKYDTSKPSAYSQLCLDITKARSIGWAPRVSLTKGLRKTYEWYSEVTKREHR